MQSVDELPSVRELAQEHAVNPMIIPKPTACFYANILTQTIGKSGITIKDSLCE